ncbi:DUF2207 domain-containing protein [Gordonia sp. X0973]|uniref:DUF2207 domain-containing protein n=1 Tax=Gordonia sp. X0973 TaxID=2742602 RepID=UPI000F522339|nr:DUF2207 domain-containing protein [Gordonia sp. X0973]QKT05802.1 DUF2207 domain-containing protein [Gordonia sp. X0973]
MKRLFLSLIAVLLTVIGLVLPLSLGAGQTGGGSVDPVTVSEYKADYSVDAGGKLTATETLTTEFPYGRHGIFRYFDLADSSDPNVRYTPKNIKVTLDGHREPFTTLWEHGRRFFVAKIGSANQFVDSGTHVYTISYTIDGVLEAGNSRPGDGEVTSSWGDKNRARFRWRVVADGWSMPIDKSTVTVHLPAKTTSLACATSNNTPCQATNTEPNTVVVTTAQLGRHNGVSLLTDLEMAPPSRATVPWSIALDPILGRSMVWVLLVGLASLVTLALGALWTWRSREETPLLPVMFEPPTDPKTNTPLSPVQTYYVTREQEPGKGLTATLLFMAEQKLAHIVRQDNGDFTIVSDADPARWAQADPVTQTVARELGLTGVGQTFVADGSVDAGEKLKSAQSAVASSVRIWGVQSGAIERSGFETTGRALVGLAFIAAAVLFIFKVYPFSLAVLPIAAFAIGGAGLFVSGVGTRRTLLGRDLWSRSGGFERLLSTTSNKERLDFSARKDLYTSFIPYAVAFGAAAAWANKYRMAMGTEPPTPPWIMTPTGMPLMATTAYGLGGIDSFESSLASSISAYSASQAASSSSGGGFSGGGFSGGGGGGGGGGSW